MDLVLDFVEYFVYAVGILYLLPYIIVFGFMYATTFYLMWYKVRNLMPGQKADYKFYDGARKVVVKWWMSSMHFWYNMEVKGFEKNFPEEGPTIAVFFHGAIPVDVYYFTKYIHSKDKNYRCFGITDKFMYKFPTFQYYADLFDILDGSLETCIQRLKEGRTLILAPGGTYEGQCGDENYKILWRNRLGFAKLAILTKAKIVPVFTTNIQESFRPIGIFKNTLEKLYLKTRFPVVPMFGGLPVKLTINVGEAIQAESDMDPEELKRTVIRRMEEMIRKHQRVPGSMLMALLDRITSMF